MLLLLLKEVFMYSEGKPVGTQTLVISGPVEACAAQLLNLRLREHLGRWAENKVRDKSPGSLL